MYGVELSQTLKVTWTNSGRLKREWLQFYRHDRSVRRKFSALSGAVSNRTARGTGNSKRDKRDRKQQEGQGTARGTGNSKRDREQQQGQGGVRCRPGQVIVDSS